MRTTGHTVNAASTPKTGLFAALRGSHPALGTGVRSLIALCVLATLLALSIASVAQAEPPRLIQYGSFNPGPFALSVTVDNSGGSSQGDVYTAAFLSANLNKFDASGKLISPPSPFGEGSFSGAGAAVDPVNGDVYVLESFEIEEHEVQVQKARIDTYDPNTGALVGAPFEVPASENGFFRRTVAQIAADSAGNVYVPVVPQNEVLEYSPTGTLLKTFTGGSGTGALKGPSGVAVNSAGDLWVADAGNNRIEELSPADVPMGEIKSEGVRFPALDGHGDVFAIVKNGADPCGSAPPPCSHLLEYDAAGVQVADVGAGSFETGPFEFALTPMVGVDERSGRVYVSDTKGEKVWIFGPPVKPRVEKELASEVGTSEAKLGALVNPGGIETTYRFEYDTREYKEGEAPHGQSVPFPEGSVGEGFASHTVWAAASGLAPGTTYHYRVVATSELAPEGVAGPDETFTTLTAKEAECENEQFRGGFSDRLPDCRAYELVTPSTKTSVQISGIFGSPAASGDAILFATKEPLPGAPTGGVSYVATRALGGWTSEDIIPPESYTGVTCEQELSKVSAYSSELSKALVAYGANSRSSEPGGTTVTECNAEGLQVTSGEPVGYQNLLLRDNATGAYQLLNATPPGVTPADAHFEGASADLSHVVFAELAPLTPGAPAGVENLYEWDEGALRLLTAEGALAKASNGSQAISTDGSRIVFTSGGGLYLRVDGSSTVQVDASQTGGAGGGGSFQTMSSDGSKVFFTDENQLTSGSTAEAGKPDLYECVLPKGATRCELSDLTVAGAGEPADVLAVSRLGSRDSSHVYFTAKGVLAEGAKSGEPNLYVYEPDPEHEGQFKTVFIATLVEGDDSGVGAVSPDGSWFAFDSFKSLTGYDNVSSSGEPVDEIFLYDVTSQQLACASCSPSGEAPSPGAGAELPPFAQRPLADGGRLFFQTLEALVPSDTNGQPDVYEYEDGQPALISSGTSPEPSSFQGASESGDDVFFLSRQQLVPQDTEEEARVIYDARVEGGFPATSVPPPCTTADACRAPVAPLPSVFGAPASATFSGAGNLAPPPPPVVKPKPLTRAQKLAAALKSCRKDKKKAKRQECERQARVKYGTGKKAKKATNDRRGK